MKRSAKFIFFVLALSGLVIATPALAQRSSRITVSNLRDGHEVRAAFQTVVASSDAATVRVMCSGHDAVLGTIVGSDGWIVTKYSELRDPVICRLTDGRQLHAQVVGYDPQYDLAMLKVDATGLKTVPWSDDEHGPAVGQLVATASPSDLPIAVGVISTPERIIPPRSGWLGISFHQNDNAQIFEVLASSPAEQAGLKANDVIIHANDKAIDSTDRFLDFIHLCKPGDHLELIVKRGQDEVKIGATLKNSEEVGIVSRSERMNEMGGALSYRASSFPSVIQHDTVLRPADCGGPLVDLSGKVVGINIARAGRTESYAAPADKVRKLLADLESGKLAPKEPLPGTKESKNTSTTSPDDKTGDKPSDNKKTSS